MSSLLLSAASGAIFGSAVTAAGVYAPSIITGQMGLTNFHMFKTFVTASACSALIITGANRAGYTHLTARRDASYGWFSRYDANIVGGLLQGVGMTMTGACPGTMLVQIALGLRSAYNVAIGGVLGAIAFVRFGERLKRSSGKTDTGSNYSVQDKTGISTSSAILIYEVLCVLMILAANQLVPTKNYWLNPVLGGLLIGLAQASSILLTRKSLGVSSAYEDLGQVFWSVLNGTPGPGWSNLVFAAGLMAGAKLISQRIPIITESATAISPAVAILGGFISIFGARVAGGCTSGHGISGMATFGLSSFVTVASMFAGGIASGLLL